MALSASTAIGEFVPSPNKMDVLIVAFPHIGVNALQGKVVAEANEAALE
jgi:hypothetical protein